jgi:general secretion pathway protein G
MKRRRSEQRLFFPWERRGGLVRRFGLDRLRPVLLVLGVCLLIGVIAMRERRDTGVRRTRVILLDMRQAVDLYMADHDGQCPDSFASLADYGSFQGAPLDAWGRPLTLVCPGTEGGRYRLVSAGPDGVPGGLDRIE